MEYYYKKAQLRFLFETDNKDNDSILKKNFEISYEKNPEVEKLQKILVDKGYYIGKFGPNKDGVDGKYGPFTKAAHDAIIAGMELQKFEEKRQKMAEKYIGDIDENTLKNEFNFLKIPDGKNNYRSGQIPVKINGKEYLGEVIDKYGIKNIIRLNGDGGDSRRTSAHPMTSIQDEKELAENKGINFYALSSRRNLDKVIQILSQGNTLIHCRHGQDRTGGNVGGYLLDIGWGNTDKIWDYTTRINSWNRMIRNNPNYFVNGGFLRQAQHFGVKDLEHARKLAGLQ